MARAPDDDVVHYDFSPANALQERQRMTGILDWGGVRAGDRAFDVVTLLSSTASAGSRRRPIATAVIGVYVAHMIVRQVDFSIRRHSVQAAEQ